MKRKAFRAAFPYTIPIFAGFWFLGLTYGIPELIGIGVTVGLHLWKRQMLFSIAGGTICYMLLVQFLF